jgi:hypothetical protein
MFSTVYHSKESKTTAEVPPSHASVYTQVRASKLKDFDEVTYDGDKRCTVRFWPGDTHNTVVRCIPCTAYRERHVFFEPDERVMLTRRVAVKLDDPMFKMDAPKPQ